MLSEVSRLKFLLEVRLSEAFHQVHVKLNCRVHCKSHLNTVSPQETFQLFSFRRILYAPLGQCLRARAVRSQEHSPHRHPLHLFLFLLAFSFVLFLPSGLLGACDPGSFSRRTPCPPRTPCTFLFFPYFFVCLVLFFRLVRWHPGSFSQRTNEHPSTPLARKEKRKRISEKKRSSALCAAALQPSRVLLIAPTRLIVCVHPCPKGN